MLAVRFDGWTRWDMAVGGDHAERFDGLKFGVTADALACARSISAGWVNLPEIGWTRIRRPVPSAADRAMLSALGIAI